MRTGLLKALAMALMGMTTLAAATAPGEAQLASSAWPMLGHDLRHTGQSDLLGPLFQSGAPGAANVRSVTFYDKIKMFPVVGPGSVVYVGMGWQFCAINPLDVSVPTNPVLAQKWCVPLNADVSPNAAAVDKDGYVYVGDRDNSFYKFRGSDGQRMCVINNGHEGDLLASIAIGADGTVYAIFSQNLSGHGVVMAVTNTGPATCALKWTLVVGQFGTPSSPAVIADPRDGKPVLVAGFADSTVRAIKDIGACPPAAGGTCGASIIWKTTIGTGIGSIVASPVVGSDGTIYVGGIGGLFALDPLDGHVKWTFPTSPALIDSTGAVGASGAVYFVARNGTQRTVYAINPSAVTPANPQAGLLWTYGPITASLSPAGGFPMIGADGVVYVGMANGIYSLQPNTGFLLWQYASANGVISAPVFGTPAAPAPAASSTTSGTAVLYFGSQDHNVYAISGPRGSLAQNDPPVPNLQISPGQAVQAGTEVTFDASSSTDANGDQLFYSWDLGDGTTATGAVVHHTYWVPCGPPNACVGGAYPVALTVSDGLASTTYTPEPRMSVKGGGTAYFCDAFTRPNSSTLGSPGAAAPSCPSPSNASLQWQENSGSFSISGNQLINDPIKATHIATVDGFAAPDQAVAVDFTSPVNSTAPRLGAVLRFTDPQNYYLLYRSVGGASVLRISKVVNGVETILAWTAVPNPTVNTPFRLRASVAGSTLTLQLIGGATVSAADTTFGSGGDLGVYVFWSTSAVPSYIADNFAACVGPPGADCSAIQ